MKLMMKKLIELSKKPSLFEAGEPLFWNDPHISKNMLDFHLDGSNNISSRNFDTIEKTIEFLFNTQILKPGMKVLDLGCGPGLYAERMQKKGVKVVGVDGSQRSIEYAQKRAQELGMDIEYHCMDFFDMQFSNTFDAVIQVYGELNTFSPAKRDELLSLVHQSLKEGGKFIFDVTTREHRSKSGIGNRWYSSKDGFWCQGEYMVLEQGYDYPEESVWLDQILVLNEAGIKVYRNWFMDYDLNDITRILAKADFELVDRWNELSGQPYIEGGEWIALLAIKK